MYLHMSWATLNLDLGLNHTYMVAYLYNDMVLKLTTFLCFLKARSIFLNLVLRDLYLSWWLNCVSWLKFSLARLELIMISDCSLPIYFHKDTLHDFWHFHYNLFNTKSRTFWYIKAYIFQNCNNYLLKDINVLVKKTLNG